MPTEITGWDHFGPTATLNSQICAQQGQPGNYYFGTLIHIASDGTHLDRIGGSTCNAWDELADGTVLCGGDDWQSFTVRRRDGTILWSGTASDILFGAMLSPDGNAVGSQSGQIVERDATTGATSARTAEPQIRIVGWADPNTLVVLQADGRIGLVPARQPVAFDDLGITLSKSCPTCGYYDVRVAGILPLA